MPLYFQKTFSLRAAVAKCVTSTAFNNRPYHLNDGLIDSCVAFPVVLAI